MGRLRKINIGLIGLGYWGPNYIRLINENKKTKLAWACDKDSARFEKVKEKYPNLKIKFVENFKNSLKDVDAVLIATPWATHFELARFCLRENKHVLVEKPITETAQEAKQLWQLAKRKKKILFVDHLFIYNSYVRKLKELIQSNKLGKVLYLTEEYLALGPLRQDANALWDLGLHFIYTSMFLLNSQPVSISVVGSDYLFRGIEDVCFIRLDFDNKIKVNISASWLFPEKTRKIVVVGSKAMAVFDDVQPEHKLHLYKKGAAYLEKDVPYVFWDEGIEPVEVSPVEPLKESFSEFVQAIVEKRKPLTDGEEGLKVVKVVQAGQRSLKLGGKEVLLL